MRHLVDRLVDGLLRVAPWYDADAVAQREREAAATIRKFHRVTRLYAEREFGTRHR